MPKVSVLLPVFNAEDTLFRAAFSCLNQSYSDLELIIINDGSSDNTSDTCDQLVNEDSRVKIIEFKSNKTSKTLPRWIKFHITSLHVYILLISTAYAERIELQD